MGDWTNIHMHAKSNLMLSYNNLNLSKLMLQNLKVAFYVNFSQWALSQYFPDERK